MQRGRYDAVTEIPILIPCSYAERDGTVNLASPKASFGATYAGLEPVRVLSDAELDRNTGAGRKFWAALPAGDRDRLVALIGLRQALESNDLHSIEKREQAYRQIMPEVLAAKPSVPESARADYQAMMARLFAERGKSLNVIERLLTHALRPARLILWRQEKPHRLLPAVYCPDAATALYVRALVKISGGNALSVCPRCGNPFLQKRSDQDYCTIRCREAHRVARWRVAKAKGNKARRRR